MHVEQVHHKKSDYEQTDHTVIRLVVVDFLALTPAKEGRLGALVVDVGPKILLQRYGRLLGDLNSLVDGSLRLLVDSLEKDAVKMGF